MRGKSTKGFTLVELILAVSIIAIVTAAVATAVFDNVNSIIANRKLEEDQYYARLALLSITREVHHGFTHITVNDTADKLTLHLRNGSPVDDSPGVDYVFENGILYRDDPPKNGYYSSIHPISIKLDEVVFRTVNNNHIKDPDNPDNFENGEPKKDENGTWLYIKIKCNGIDDTDGEGLELETTISTNRIGIPTAPEP
jgi:prepilin-type N-terminal cleavage/methylation domain-containing protein